MGIAHVAIPRAIPGLIQGGQAAVDVEIRVQPVPCQRNACAFWCTPNPGRWEEYLKTTGENNRQDPGACAAALALIRHAG